MGEKKVTHSITWSGIGSWPKSIDCSSWNEMTPIKIKVPVLQMFFLNVSVSYKLKKKVQFTYTKYKAEPFVYD